MSVVGVQLRALLAVSYFAATVLCQTYVDEQALHRSLLGKERYSANVVPRTALNESGVVVTIAMTLQAVVNLGRCRLRLLDAKSGIGKFDTWITMSYTDKRLSWKKEQNGGLKETVLPVGSIWTPDIFLYNELSEEKKAFADDKHPAVIRSDGGVTAIVPRVLNVRCDTLVANASDTYRCTFKFGSWSYSGEVIDLQKGSIDTSTLAPDPCVTLNESQVNRNELRYECCPERFYDVTFVLTFKRNQKCF